MHAIIRRLTVLLIVFHSSFCIRHSSFAQGTEAVIKTKATDALTESIVIPTGKSITINSGATITNNGTATGFGGGGAFSTLTDVTLTSLASGDFLKWSGTAWINRTAVNARTDLGLGTIATQAASAVAITGGTLSGITSFAIANTGTVNATSAASLRLPNAAIATSSALSLVSVANGGSGYELHFGDKDGVDRTVMTLDYAQTPTNKTISGATNTITDLNASNLSSGTVDAARMPALTGDVTTSAGAVATTLATVNSNVGSFTNASITVNAKGLVTAASSGSAGATLSANTFTGQQIISTAGAASTPPLALTGAWYSGGSGTTTKPQLLIEPSGVTSNGWSTSGTGLGISVAGSSATRFIDCLVAGSSKFSVSTYGNIETAGQMSLGSWANFDSNSQNLNINNTFTFKWSSTSSYAGAKDLILSRGAAGILDLYGNSTGAAIQMTEQTAPAAPAANKGIIFLEDNGAGKTRLMIRFSTGAAQQIAIEP